MVDVFDEVNEELKEDEFAVWLKKYGPKIIILAFLLILFTASRVIYTNHKSSVNQKQTQVLSEILNLDNEEVDQMSASSQDLNRAHKFLGDFLIAGSYAENGDLVKANEVYEKILNDKKVSKEYKQIATIYIVQNILNMENGDLAKAKELIKPMLNKENAYYYMAIEQNAIIEAKQGNTTEAKNIFEVLSNDYDAPEEVKTRAEKLKTLY